VITRDPEAMPLGRAAPVGDRRGGAMAERERLLNR